MTGNTAELFGKLIGVLDLTQIKPLQLHSVQSGVPSGEMKMEWRQYYADEDPIRQEEKILVFRPKLVFHVKSGDAAIFEQISVFWIGFTIMDNTAFEEIWKNEEVRAVFKEKQIQRTLWPIFRQHILDGMSRLGIPPVVLPWLV